MENCNEDKIKEFFDNTKEERINVTTKPLEEDLANAIEYYNNKTNVTAPNEFYESIYLNAKNIIWIMYLESIVYKEFYKCIN